MGFRAFHDLKVEALVLLAIAGLIFAIFGPTLRGWRLASPVAADAG
jgi:hypothetical protein